MEIVTKPKQFKRLPQLNKMLQRLKRNLPTSEFVLHCQKRQERLGKAGLDVWDSLKLSK